MERGVRLQLGIQATVLRVRHRGKPLLDSRLRGRRQAAPAALSDAGQSRHIGKPPRRHSAFANARAGDPRRKVADFVAGAGEGVYDVAKDTVAGVRSLLTTNPVTSAKQYRAGDRWQN